jgi:hypothetical protein
MRPQRDPLVDKILLDLTTEKKHPTLDKILAFLAGSGSCSKWQIAKALGLSYGNTYGTIKDLLQNELIIILETRASGKNKKIDVEYYGLTLLGFLIALNVVQVKPENKALIVSLIEKQNHLHPLFAKWNTLMQQVPHDTLFPALSSAVHSTYYEWSYLAANRIFYDMMNYFTEKMLRLVENESYGLYERKYLSSLDMWLEAIRQDKELKDYVETRIKKSIIKDRETLEYHEEILKKLS